MVSRFVGGALPGLHRMGTSAAKPTGPRLVWRLALHHQPEGVVLHHAGYQFESRAVCDRFTQLSLIHAVIGGSWALTGDERRELREILCEAFNRAELTQALAESTPSRKFEEFVGANNYPNQVFELIEAADRRGWGAELVEILERERPTRQDLIARARTLPLEKGTEAEESDEELSALRKRFLTTDRPQELRRLLYEVQSLLDRLPGHPEARELESGIERRLSQLAPLPTRAREAPVLSAPARKALVRRIASAAAVLVLIAVVWQWDKLIKRSVQRPPGTEFRVDNFATPFAVKGEFSGMVTVHSGEIRVDVSDARFSLPEAPPAEPAGQYLRSIRLELARGRNGGWESVLSTEAVPIDATLAEGDSIDIPVPELVLPRAGIEDLGAYWLVFTIEVSGSAGDPNVGLSHVELPRGLLGGHSLETLVQPPETNSRRVFLVEWFRDRDLSVCEDIRVDEPGAVVVARAAENSFFVLDECNLQIRAEALELWGDVRIVAFQAATQDQPGPAPSGQPQPPKSGWNQHLRGYDGSPGLPGADGANGSPGKSAGIVELMVPRLEGDGALSLDLSGQSGGRGQPGGRGGPGQTGAGGGPAEDGFASCKRGSGTGGNGGRGGKGGNGGAGGNGGDGGLVRLHPALSQTLGDRLPVVVASGTAGLGGEPGAGGDPGAGGGRGSGSRFCGVQPPPWRHGQPGAGSLGAGQRGADGVPGQDGSVVVE